MNEILSCNLVTNIKTKEYWFEYKTNNGNIKSEEPLNFVIVDNKAFIQKHES